MRDDDPGARHRRDIDRIVADAMAGHDAQPAIGASDRGLGHPRQVHIERVIARRVVGGDDRNDLGQVFPRDVRRAIQYFQRCGSEGRQAARIEDVAREPDVKGFAHRQLLLLLPAVRSTSSPLASAFCSISGSIPYAIRRKPLAA